MTPRPLPDLRSVGSAVRLPTMVSSFMRMLPGRTCSGRRGDPNVAAGELGEDVEGPAAVLGRGSQVGAHRAEVLSASEGAHAPGHLLLDLHHADVALGRVVVERNPRVDGEPQVVLQAP